jgi:hypothetical protein
MYSGKSKIDFCRRLGNDWQDLADYLEIPPYRRRQFQQGHECQAIWEWLEEKDRLQELPEALKYINRDDLLSVLQQEAESILFYLPDRKQQKEGLKKAIKAYQAQYSDKKQRPLLCLMHGNDNEYGNFIKCLLEDFLPNNNVLSEYFRNGLLEIELLIEEFHTVDKLHQEILQVLENKINAKPEKEAIAHQLARERRPIIVHLRLLTKDLEDWQDDDKTIIDGFIEFWADWPKKIYAQHPLFLVFLSFSYEARKNHFSVVNWLRQKKSRKATNSALLNKFENLNNKFPTIMAFFESEKVHAKVLQKLDSVKRIQACNWIKTYEDQIRKFCNDTYALEHKVKALYKNRDAIPMEELARELKTIIVTTQP